jgi:hypothetical protein
VRYAIPLKARPVQLAYEVLDNGGPAFALPMFVTGQLMADGYVDGIPGLGQDSVANMIATPMLAGVIGTSAVGAARSGRLAATGGAAGRAAIELPTTFAEMTRAARVGRQCSKRWDG